MDEQYHFQWGGGTWKGNVQIHHSYSRISSNSNSHHFSQGSSSDYAPVPCSASRSEKNIAILLLWYTEPELLQLKNSDIKLTDITIKHHVAIQNIFQKHHAFM
jgi:hypothetical protein